MRLLTLILIISIQNLHCEDIVINQITIEMRGGKYLNRKALTVIKDSIIKAGKRETYCNMYNNNPVMIIDGISLRLDPDSGQDNINCELSKSDFQTIVISELGYTVVFKYEDIKVSFPKKEGVKSIEDYIKIIDDKIGELYNKVKISG